MRTGPQYDFDHYRQLVHEITQAFCGISTEVLEIKRRLHLEFDRADLSEHIEKLQSKEKQKLELVCDCTSCDVFLIMSLKSNTVQNVYRSKGVTAHLF